MSKTLVLDMCEDKHLVEAQQLYFLNTQDAQMCTLASA